MPALLDDLTLPPKPPASMSRVKRNGTFSGNGSPPPRSKAIPKSMLINSPVLSCKMRLSASWFSVSLTTCLQKSIEQTIKMGNPEVYLEYSSTPTKQYQLNLFKRKEGSCCQVSSDQRECCWDVDRPSQQCSLCERCRSLTWLDLPK